MAVFFEGYQIHHAPFLHQELTPDEPCCCLAWALAKESADSVRAQHLSRLHAEIHKQVKHRDPKMGGCGRAGVGSPGWVN